MSMQLTEDQKHLLQRIDAIENNNLKKIEAGFRPEPATRHVIYRGCYDVWHTRQDEIDATEIPKRILAESEELGIIAKKAEKYYGYEVWELTDKGKECLYPCA